VTVVSHYDADKSAISKGTTKQHPSQENGLSYPGQGVWKSKASFRDAQKPSGAPQPAEQGAQLLVFSLVAHSSLGRGHLLSPRWYSEQQKLSHRPHMVSDTCSHARRSRYPLLGRTITLGRYWS